MSGMEGMGDMGRGGGMGASSNAFIDKLCEHAPLPSEDVRLLTEACHNQRTFPARTDLIRQGDKPGPVFVILEGWACRYELLPEARVRSPRS
jgi:hypothetical protein